MARLLIAGVSVRALAASILSSRAAARFPGGFVALDYFGDADLVALAVRHPLRVISLPRDLGLPRSLVALGRAALDLRWEALVCAGGLENHPALLRRLERRGIVLGNGGAEVAPVRDPATLFAFLEERAIPHAPTFPDRSHAPRSGRYLWKAIRSGGGARVGWAAAGQERPPEHYLQEFLDGPVGSAALLAAGGRAVVLGVTEQIVGSADLGGIGFRYGGNIAGPPADLLPPRALAILARAGSALAARFGLCGLFGIDFVLTSGLPLIIEVNPRYTASMELFEELAARNLFDLHLEAIEGGPLPAGPLAPRSASPRFLAKGILYARGEVRAGDPEKLLALGCRDVPVRGEIVRAGQPICTLVEPGDSPAACRQRLAAKADVVRAALDRPAVDDPTSKAPDRAQTARLTAFSAVRRSW